MKHCHPDFELIIDGESVPHKELTAAEIPAAYHSQPHLQPVFLFIRKWLSGEAYFLQQTSGSTGKPKEITLTREQMQASANMTCTYFNLSDGDNALLCISADYIGGKMMLVRAMEFGLKLWVTEPKANPFKYLKEIPTFHFITMVPYQLEAVLAESPEALQKQVSLKALILGGAETSETLEAKTAQLPFPIYSTYGMTETASHIAVRKLNQQPRLFEAFDEVELGQDDRNCLTIRSKVTAGEKIVTNDVVELHDSHHFTWLGRADNIINTGGVKVQIEELERKISLLFSSIGVHVRFAISAQKDEKLGERIVLVLEGDTDRVAEIEELLMQRLSKYEKPKQIFTLDALPETDSGKVDRKRL